MLNPDAILWFIINCFRGQTAYDALIVVAWAVERFLLLRHLPLRRARTQWPVAVVVAVAQMQFESLTSGGGSDLVMHVTRAVIIEQLSTALTSAAILSVLDSVLVWWLSGRLAAQSARTTGMLPETADVGRA